MLRRLVGFDGVARREQYSVTRRRGAHPLLRGIFISGRLAPCACNWRQGAPKRVSDLAYADIRARRMRQCMRPV